MNIPAVDFLYNLFLDIVLSGNSTGDFENVNALNEVILQKSATKSVSVTRSFQHHVYVITAV